MEVASERQAWEHAASIWSPEAPIAAGWYWVLFRGSNRKWGVRVTRVFWKVWKGKWCLHYHRQHVNRVRTMVTSRVRAFTNGNGYWGPRADIPSPVPFGVDVHHFNSETERQARKTRKRL